MDDVSSLFLGTLATSSNRRRLRDVQIRTTDSLLASLSFKYDEIDILQWEDDDVGNIFLTFKYFFHYFIR